MKKRLGPYSRVLHLYQICKNYFGPNFEVFKIILNFRKILKNPYLIQITNLYDLEYLEFSEPLNASILSSLRPKIAFLAVFWWTQLVVNNVF